MTNAPRVTGFPHAHFGASCTDGWQVCMSSLCAANSGGESSAVVPPLATDAPVSDESSTCTATDGSCDAATTMAGAGRRRQVGTFSAAGTGFPQATGGDDRPTATGGAGPVETGGVWGTGRKKFVWLCSLLPHSFASSAAASSFSS